MKKEIRKAKQIKADLADKKIKPWQAKEKLSSIAVRLNISFQELIAIS